MPGCSLRFVHASDLHLDQPLFGMPDLPEPWKEQLVDAPLAAAQQVFETALTQDADFVLLAGDVLDCRKAAAREIAFLVDQFERLNERSIDVYWAAGKSDDPDHWPAAIHLPHNVHVFSKGKVEQFTHARDDGPMVTIQGTSRKGKQGIRPARFRARSDHYTIAVAHGNGEAESLQQQSVDYWALGGRHNRQALGMSSGLARYCGTPQARCPREVGPHGCLLVHVAEDAEVRTQFVATDSIRFAGAKLTVSESASVDDLEAQAGEQVLNLLAEADNHPLLVSWTVSAPAPTRPRIRREGLLSKLASWLRQEFSDGAPAAWTIGMELDAQASVPSSWYDEDTILGDFLRAAQDQQETSDAEPNLVSDAVRAKMPPELAEAIRIGDSAERRELLRESALLGADLLRGTDAA